MNNAAEVAFHPGRRWMTGRGGFWWCSVFTIPAAEWGSLSVRRSSPISFLVLSVLLFTCPALSHQLTTLLPTPSCCQEETALNCSAAGIGLTANCSAQCSPTHICFLNVFKHFHCLLFQQFSYVLRSGYTNTNTDVMHTSSSQQTVRGK